jgi:hypothetical protein
VSHRGANIERMFGTVSTLREGLEEAVAGLDTDGLDGPGAARMFEEFAAIERLSGNAKTLVVRRLGQTQGWRGQGDRSFAHYVARKTRTTLAAATAVVKGLSTTAPPFTSATSALHATAPPWTVRRTVAWRRLPSTSATG